MRHPTQLSSGSIDWSKTRLLVFSLDDSFRFLARQTFRKLAVREVLSTSVPADAAPMLAQVPDVALVDVDGDLETALAFLKRVRDADPGLPVLLVAKSDDRPRLAPALTLGIEDVVPKPVSGHELVHRVGEVLKHPRRLPPPPPPKPPEPKLSAISSSGGGDGFAGRGRVGAGSYGDAAPASAGTGGAVVMPSFLATASAVALPGMPSAATPTNTWIRFHNEVLMITWRCGVRRRFQSDRPDER